MRMMCVGCHISMPLSLPFCQVRIAVLEFIVRTYPWTDFYQASLFVPRHLMGCLVLLELRFPITLDVMAPHPLLRPHQAGGSTLH